MLESLIYSYNLTPFQWTLAVLAALIVGISKAGLNSLSIINVTILAIVFGSKISTGMLFLFVNLFKLPFHIFSWHTVNMASIGVNLVLLPVQIIGFYVGVAIVKRIDEARYRQLILWLTAFAALFVFF